MNTGRTYLLKTALLALGFVAMANQVIFIRKALELFQGNELVIGLCLGIWMMLTALGAYAGSRIGRARDGSRHYAMVRFRLWIMILFMIMGIMSFIMGGWMVWLKNMILPHGAVAGLSDILIILLFTISPFCIASGMLFPLLTDRLSSARQKNRISLAYALDSAGSILGGLLLGLVIFIWPLNSDYLPLDKWTKKMLFPGQEVIESVNSPYGKLTLTRIADQYSLFINGDPMLLAGDAIQCEEPVHYAMLLHPGPRSVLMIGGGTGGAIEEVFKYSVARVDYLEINPWLTAMADRHFPFPEDSRLKIINRDPRNFLARNDARYDVILVNAPDPNSAEVNRFYTREFYSQLRENLEPGGVVSLSLAAAGNYMNETSRRVHSVVYKTLKHSFANVRIIPGYRDYFIASDRDLDRSLWDKLTEEGIANAYVNPQYINEMLMEARSRLILESLTTDARTNADLSPFVYMQYARQWLAQFGIDHRLIPAVLAVLVILGFIFLGPLNLGLFIGGFTSATLEFLLIIWFQVLFGNVYQMTGVIFSVFMGGMAIGALFRHTFYKKETFYGYLGIQALMAGFCIFITLLMQIIHTGPSAWVFTSLVLGMVFITGLLMGLQFSLSGHLRKTRVRRSAGESFSVDLAGSAIGILLVSAYLVPVAGLPMTASILAGLNAVAVVAVYFKGR